MDHSLPAVRDSELDFNVTGNEESDNECPGNIGKGKGRNCFR